MRCAGKLPPWENAHSIRRWSRWNTPSLVCFNVLNLISSACILWARPPNSSFLKSPSTSNINSPPTMLNTLTFRALFTLCATVSTFSSAAYFEGDGTTYTLGGVSNGNCNLMSWNSIAPTNYGALNNEQWNNLGNCGRCAQVSCIDEACADQTASAIVQIVDRCPECKYGDLDLSPSVFKTITGSDPSRLSIRWQFVDCPNPETVKICLKTGSNGFWVAVQPTNAVIGVKSVSINGISASMINGAYYYLITSTSEVDLTAVDVSVTSINGQVIEGTYSLSAGQCTDTSHQFETTSTTPATTSPTTAPSTNAPTVAPTTTPAPTAGTLAPTTTPPPATTAPVKCYVRRNRH